MANKVETIVTKFSADTSSLNKAISISMKKLIALEKVMDRVLAKAKKLNTK